MPPIKFRERLTKFMISISLSKKLCCQNLITSIKVINMTRNSSKSNKFSIDLKQLREGVITIFSNRAVQESITRRL